MDEEEAADISTNTFVPDLEEPHADDPEPVGQDFEPSPFSRVPDAEVEDEEGVASTMQSPFKIDTSAFDQFDEAAEASASVIEQNLKEQNVDDSEPIGQDLEPSPFSRVPDADSEEGADGDAASIIQSPFDIDESPFESEESEESEEIKEADVMPVANPFLAGDDDQPHTVTQEDHDRIEDLLKQFRDRYGRE